MRFRPVWIFCLLLSVMIGLASSAQPQPPGPSPLVRREASDLLLMFNMGVKMALLGCNGELLVPSGHIPPASRREEAQEILNYVIGKKDRDYVETKNPPLAVPKNWDGTGIADRAAKLSEELDHVINRGEMAPGLARLLRASVSEITFLIKRVAALAREALKSENERQLGEKLCDVKILLIAARGAREDALLEGGLRAVLANLPTQ